MLSRLISRPIEQSELPALVEEATDGVYAIRIARRALGILKSGDSVEVKEARLMELSSEPNSLGPLHDLAPAEDHRAAIAALLEPFRGKWSPPAHHDAVLDQLVHDIDDPIAKQARKSHAFVLDLGDRVKQYSLRLVLGEKGPVGSPGPCVVLSARPTSGNGYDFEPLSLFSSPVNPDPAWFGALDLYSAIGETVNGPLFMQYARELMLADDERLSQASPLRAVIESGSFKFAVLIPTLALKTSGLVVCQLCIDVEEAPLAALAAEELAEELEAIAEHATKEDSCPFRTMGRIWPSDNDAQPQQPSKRQRQ